MTTSAENLNTSPKEFKSLAILLADDVLDLRALMSAWLEESGHTVTCASNGRDVVRLVQARDFDVVITDILMPDGDGWDAIAEVCRLRPEAAIVAMSGGAKEIPANAALRVARKA